MIRWLSKLFGPKPAPFKPYAKGESNPNMGPLPGSTIVLPQAAIVHEAPKLVTSVEAQQRFQVLASSRQVASMGTSLRRAEEDLAAARNELFETRDTLAHMRILCYCEHAGAVCTEAECRVKGCVTLLRLYQAGEPNATS